MPELNLGRTAKVIKIPWNQAEPGNRKANAACGFTLTIFFIIYNRFGLSNSVANCLLNKRPRARRDSSRPKQLKAKQRTRSCSIRTLTATIHPQTNTKFNFYVQIIIYTLRIYYPGSFSLISPLNQHYDVSVEQRVPPVPAPGAGSCRSGTNCELKCVQSRNTHKNKHKTIML